ncbi:hypothetical protein J4423_01915 [Candidatus Pacearchaeota archaeon]|nr:hypothetical protein [Candidatus Pacearchaeota archaeon]
MGIIKKLKIGSLALAGLLSFGCSSDNDPAVYSIVKAEQKQKQDISKFSLSGLLKVINETQNSEDMINAGRLAVEKVKQSGSNEAILGFSERAYTIGDEEIKVDEFKKRLSGPVIFNKNSRIYSLFNQNFQGYDELVNNNLDWIILSPNVIASNTGKSEAGLSIGNKTIFIDTEEGGKLRDFEVLHPVIVHEATHEYNRANKPDISRLEDELLAHKSQSDVATRANSKKSSENLEGMIKVCNNRVDTANYLISNFSPDFNGLYPHEMILSAQILESRIPIETINKYETINTGNEKLDLELSTALRISKIPHTYSKKDSIERLYSIVQNGTEIERTNAYSVLELFNTSIFSKNSSPDWVNSGERRVNFGFNFGNGNGQGGGLPSLSDFVDLFTNPLLQGQKDKKIYEDVQDGDKLVRLSEEDSFRQNSFNSISTNNSDNSEILRKLNHDFSKVAGDPDGSRGSWTYKGYAADRKGKTIVMWQSNDLKIKNRNPRGVSDELFLTKQDVYVGGTYSNSSWDFIDPYRDLDFTANPPVFYK